MSHQHFFGQAPQIFQKSRCHFEILGARRVAWSKFHTGDPQFWSGLWILLLSGAFCFLHVNWYTFFYERGKKTAIIVLKIFVATIQNFVMWATGHPRFVHFCLCDCLLHCMAAGWYHISHDVLKHRVSSFFLLMLECYACCYLFHCEMTCVTLLKETSGELLFIHTFLIGV
jgi:hypothetical protein